MTPRFHCLLLVHEVNNSSPLPLNLLERFQKIPFKVLEAPQIQDDFYLNLVDWSSQNLLAVGLNHSVYLWNALTSQVVRLYDGGSGVEMVTSLSWMGKGTHLAIGSSSGSVALWDVAKQKKKFELFLAIKLALESWLGVSLLSGCFHQVPETELFFIEMCALIKIVLANSLDTNKRFVA